MRIVIDKKPSPTVLGVYIAWSGNCPLCGSGVNKWGHTKHCPLWLALQQMEKESAAPDVQQKRKQRKVG